MFSFLQSRLSPISDGNGLLATFLAHPQNRFQCNKVCVTSLGTDKPCCRKKYPTRRIISQVFCTLPETVPTISPILHIQQQFPKKSGSLPNC